MVLRIIDEPLDLALSQFEPPALQTSLSQQQCCRLAVMMAYQGLGQVSPNPLVGAVIVDAAGRLIGMGAHRKHGGAHAEIDALSALSSSQLKGATIYVTLEPCTIDGHTPACAPRLAKEPFARVVFGAIDPHPKVSGRGAQILRDAGIACDHLVSWHHECTRLAEVFMHDCQTGRPFVALKVASGLDGNVARQGDQRRWITGPRARQYGHFLRTYYDAILVGRGTVEADDPQLDARDALGGGRSPRRVVLDPSARLAESGRSYKIFRADQQKPTLWLVGEQRAQVAKQAYPDVEVCPLALTAGSFDYGDILHTLYQRGIRSLMVEGGATTAAGWIGSGLIDRVHAFQAASIAGGPESLNWSASGPEKTDIRLTEPELTLLGEDWLISANVAQLAKEST